MVLPLWWVAEPGAPRFKGCFWVSPLGAATRRGARLGGVLWRFAVGRMA